ncbi:GntR family transcriptional regulator [Serratia marcescens]|jgi:Transcriptional regulators|uniref:GntR family transcriptional regulator n=1 Tax=Serratia marcescens TaxID=615 RepID=A0AAP8PHP1_SERMA|nr:GntR family transcriptional regulator [Serratia marcescens]MBN5201842.1 GntR family transcriptional regulator [Serratia marcescens]MBN5381178.1 GntR family transcriptional regulator [Serratia marcescens]PNO69745.1 GntR family transcriptional regulator [Serratia marcescens]QDI19535.1 GntR family transcriptional regulator [Serratia marcescens]QDI29279.1 GntR family transcriptional regulator [Serratia marcescens]
MEKTRVEKSSGEVRAGARYEMIRQTLDEAIRAGSVPAGLVLLEGPLADMFGTSRVPVRKALGLLHQEGLIARFEGRGFIVTPEGGEVEPQRLPLNRAVLGLCPQEELVDTRSTSEKVFSDLQEALSTCMVFGHYQVNEASAAEFYNVSRSAIREALMRLRDQGLVEKEPYAQWLAGPLTAREITDHYEIRACLEPAALLKAAPHLSRQHVLDSLERLTQLEQGTFSLASLERVEEDLHIHCLAPAGNKTLLGVLRQSQSPLIVTRIFYDMLGIKVEEAMLNEHRLVLQMLLQGANDAAALGLQEHLRRAQMRTLQRLKVISVLPEPALPPYLLRLS